MEPTILNCRIMHLDLTKKPYLHTVVIIDFFFSGPIISVFSASWVAVLSTSDATIQTAGITGGQESRSADFYSGFRIRIRMDPR